MYHQFRSHADILSLWKGPKYLVRLAEDIGVSRWRARMWRDRDSIPPAYWPQVIDAVWRRFGVEITSDELMWAAKRAHQERETRRAAAEREAEAA